MSTTADITKNTTTEVRDQKLQDQDLGDTTRRRITAMDGSETIVRGIKPSAEAIKALGKFNDRHEIIGLIAINPTAIEREILQVKTNLLRSIALLTQKQLEQMKALGPIDFVKNKQEKGYKKYELYCNQCGENIGYLWARDETLTDWCDLHYRCWYDKNYWNGAMSVNISPVDEQLGFECACGEDTRDYRANKTLPPIQKRLMTEYSLRHREFAKPTSKFSAIALT